MQTKRLIVLGVSLAVGAVATWLIIYVLFGTTVSKFPYSNAGLVFISIASAVGIWLDYFLGTKILKS
ncbi:MAG: hypothetical protein ACRDH2_11765 [Anaerolineales bacterium]